MIYLMKFNKRLHRETVELWLELHGHPIPKASSYPKIGFVAYNKQEPIAAGFVRKVEGGYGQLDGLVSNPTAPGSYRHKAIDSVVTQLFKEAKKAGITQLISFTRDKSVLERSVKHGFIQMDDYTLIGVDLLSSGQEDK